MRSNRTKSGPRQDNKTRQVCALAERSLSLALASSSDPRLQALQVIAVLPSPTVARLLVVVQPSVDVPGTDIEQTLTALDAHRSALRSELASELNRKRTPELSFTIGAAERIDAPDVGRPAPAPPWSPQRPTLVRQPLLGAEVRFTKREHPRNEKRARRRQEKLALRRGAPPSAASSLYDLTTPAGAVPIKRWTRGVPVEDAALQQLENIARLPIVHPWVAAMPDMHLGLGATVGSVVPTRAAIIPAAVGVDIGCGMMALRTTLTSSALPDSLASLRSSIERAIPHGRGKHGGRGDPGSWDVVPNYVGHVWKDLQPEFERLADKHPALRKSNHAIHLGTLGTGNHFIELCVDESDRIWVMLHSGSRGVGNRIGTYFIELAKRDMERHVQSLPHKDLAYLREGSEHFTDYVQAVSWAQTFARSNREIMMRAVLRTLRETPNFPSFQTDKQAINCHHNYVTQELHHGETLYITRKGAVSAQNGELGIIPGSMGARSFIVRGKGNPESFCSCSHGAGRRMSRTQAKARFTVDDHARSTAGVECRKDRDVLDETPQAYKDIDSVMAAQRDLVDIEHTLKQVICVKG